MEGIELILLIRRVAKLKTEHKDLKARFEKAKSEGQVKVGQVS